MGVLTIGMVPAGKVFGPVPSNLTLSDPALLIGHMTCDNRPDIHTVKIDLTDVGGEERAGEWVPYVQPARDEREQNLEAYLKEGQLHYRATRTIGAGEEVLIWYSKDMATALGVPELMPFHIKEGGVFFCPYCMETFRYPNSLRAHMRFKCEHRRQIHPIGLSGLSGLRPPGPIPREVHERLFPTLGFDYRTANLEKATHGAFPYPGYPNFTLSLSVAASSSAPLSSTAPLSSSSSHMSTTSPVGTMLHSPASSTSSMGMGSGGAGSGDKHSPASSERSTESNQGEPWPDTHGSSSSRASPGKRSLDGEDEGADAPHKRLALSTGLNIGDSTGHSLQHHSNRGSSPVSPSRPRSTDSHHSGKSSPGSQFSHASDLPKSYNGGIEPKLDRNQNINTTGTSDLSDDENLSAFRKVEKRSELSPDLRPSHPGGVSSADSLYKLHSSLQPPSTLYSPTPINGFKTSSTSQPEKVFGNTAGLPHPSFLPRLALFQGGAPGMSPSLFQGSAHYNENLPLSMSDIYRNSLNSKSTNGGGAGGPGSGPGGIPGLARPTSEKLTDIHNIENNSQYAKMLFMPTNPSPAVAAAAAMSMRFSANPFYKSQNPMVEKLLHTQPVPRVPPPFSMSLTQNWCAKCNASFRMTSDLVYHMRSHHKEEPQVKKKREDKLCCTVCGETFRERHHLTRHMTSHQ